jgi:serine/threonine-protein kinase
MSGEPQKQERITQRPAAPNRPATGSGDLLAGTRDPASSTRPRMTRKEIADTSLISGTTIAGRYRVERLLGSGGMGSVYEATQLAIGRRVAIKVLRPDVADDPFIEARFQREARAAASVHHPNVVVVHEFGRGDDGTLFLAMELLHGDSLLVRLRKGGPIAPREAVRIASEIASALEAAHAAGVVHRDLKPDNVTLLSNGGLKVLDFGIARILQSDREETSEDRAQLTDAQQVLGTPRYISPEAVARLPVGPSADLYALGAILFEMLTGRPVFLDKEPVILMGQHLRDRPPLLREAAPELEAPVELETLVDELLRKLPTERPASASVVQRRLASLDWSGRLVRDATKATVAPPSSEELLEPDELDELPAAGTSRARPVSRGVADVVSPPKTAALSPDLGAKPPPPTLTPEAVLFQAPAARPGRADWVTPRTHKRPNILGGLLLVISVLAVAGLLVVHRMRLDEERARLEAERAATTPPATTEAPPDPLGPRVQEALITVQTNAPSPVVRWDGETMEGAAFAVPVDGRPHRLEVSARGYGTRAVEVVADGPHTVELPLTRGRSRPR